MWNLWPLATFMVSLYPGLMVQSLPLSSDNGIAVCIYINDGISCSIKRKNNSTEQGNLLTHLGSLMISKQ